MQLRLLPAAPLVELAVRRVPTRGFVRSPAQLRLTRLKPLDVDGALSLEGSKPLPRAAQLGAQLRVLTARRLGGSGRGLTAALGCSELGVTRLEGCRRQGSKEVDGRRWEVGGRR